MSTERRDTPTKRRVELAPHSAEVTVGIGILVKTSLHEQVQKSSLGRCMSTVSCDAMPVASLFERHDRQGRRVSPHRREHARRYWKHFGLRDSPLKIQDAAFFA